MCEWVSVKEQLPPELETILFLSKDSSRLKNKIFTGSYLNYHENHNIYPTYAEGFNLDIEDVTHWTLVLLPKKKFKKEKS